MASLFSFGGSPSRRFSLTLIQPGTGENGDLPIAGRLIEIAFLALADLPEQSGEDRAMDRFVAGGGVGDACGGAASARHGVGDVARECPAIPAAGSAKDSSLLRNGAARCGLAFSGIARQMFSSAPKSESGVLNAPMRCRGSLFFIIRPLARIGHAQAGGDHEHFRQRAFLAGLEQHPTQGGINRQPREIASEAGEVHGRRRARRVRATRRNRRESQVAAVG